MSAPVQTSLASLKAATAQLVDIISGARHIPAGTGEAHLALTAKATTLVGAIVRDFQNGPYMPGIVASCSKELLRVRSMTPRVWPNWHSIGHDDPRVSKHAWRSKVRAWEALGDNSCDLPVMPNPSTSPLTVDLPSPPIIPSPPVLPSPPGLPAPRVAASPVTGLSTNTTAEFQSKGKGKAIDGPLVPEVGGSRKCKSPLISVQPSEPLKSAMKSRKRVKSTPDMKSSLVVESEDDDDAIIKPILSGVLEVVLPRSSTIVVRTPHSPRSPGSPKKQAFGPASLTAGGRPEVPETSGSHPTPANNPPAIPTFDITVPGPDVHQLMDATEQPLPLLLQGGLALPKSFGQEDKHSLSVLCLLCHQEAQMSTCIHGIPAPTHSRWRKTNNAKRAATPSPAPAPALAPAPPAIVSSSSRVPPAALDVSMPDLHSMAIAIQDGAARIAFLEAHVREQDDKIDTLQRLHESLRRKVIDRHPSFPLPDSPAPATFLLDQSITPSISPLPSALPNLINLDMGVMEPSSLKVEDASDMVGLIFEPSPVQPEGPQPSSEIVDPDDPGNLVPEYNSVSEEMDVEVKDETSGGEVLTCLKAYLHSADRGAFCRASSEEEPGGGVHFVEPPARRSQEEVTLRREAREAQAHGD
ncbi:hypothetical protein F4604DRAFT_1676904 [Suillus subluteus]|nr:hypothetical protein F4604DRAFT_1676904 [Suillus subluteus]